MSGMSDIIKVYLTDSGLIEDKIKEIQLTLNENVVRTLNTNMNNAKPKYLELPRKQQYKRTGHTMDSIQSDYTMNGLNGIVSAYLNQGADDYGKYVESNSIWGGYHFLEGGLEKTLQQYK